MSRVSLENYPMAEILKESLGSRFEFGKAVGELKIIVRLHTFILTIFLATFLMTCMRDSIERTPTRHRQHTAPQNYSFLSILMAMICNEKSSGLSQHIDSANLRWYLKLTKRPSAGLKSIRRLRRALYHPASTSSIRSADPLLSCHFRPVPP